MFWLTQPKFIPNFTQVVAILLPYSRVRIEAGMSMARSSLKAGKRDFSVNNRCFSWWYGILYLLLQPKNVILSQINEKVARKNERNDNDNGQMPSGSKTNVKSKSVNRWEDCILSFVGWPNGRSCSRSTDRKWTFFCSRLSAAFFDILDILLQVSRVLW